MRDSNSSALQKKNTPAAVSDKMQKMDMFQSQSIFAFDSDSC